MNRIEKEVKKITIVCNCPVCTKGRVQLIRQGELQYEFACDNLHCPTHQLFPQPLDEELREKWEDTVLPIGERIRMGVWNGRERQARAQAEISFKAGYDRALALLPDIEEAKRKERKRIFKRIERHFYRPAVGEMRITQKDLDWWQALSGKGGESMVCGYLKSVKSARSLRLNTRLLLVASRHMIIM